MKVLNLVSKLEGLPLLRKISPSHQDVPTAETKQGFLECQRLAENGAHEVASLIREGWTEKRAAEMLETFLRDSGVKVFFHHSYAWFGERTRFDGVRKYREYMPSDRAIREGEIFILDVAPILNGFTADIGFTSCLGENLEWKKAQSFLQTLREEIPALFSEGSPGSAAWDAIDQKIEKAGFENIHKKYPFSVLGHRVHQNISERFDMKYLNFGWQSYWSIASRGIFGQLLNRHHQGDLTGLWAIEPHIGTLHSDGRNRFGAKFEEILVVEPTRAYWLESERTWQ